METFLSFIINAALFIKSIPIAFIGALFGIYFSYMKLTNKITYSYSVSLRTYGDKLTDFVIQNRRDKAYVIQSIFCKLADGEISKLKEFHPPLILKPYEAISITFDEVSEWQVNTGKIYKPNFMNKFEILAFTHGKGVVKCKSEYKSEYKKDTIRSFTATFDGIVLQRDMYFILKSWNGKDSVKIIFYRSGFLDGDDHFGGYNYIDIKDSKCVTLEDIKNVIFNKGFDKQWESFIIYRIDDYNLKVVYRHSSTES